jgi:hypothetical protein
MHVVALKLPLHIGGVLIPLAKCHAARIGAFGDERQRDARHREFARVEGGGHGEAQVGGTARHAGVDIASLQRIAAQHPLEGHLAVGLGGDLFREFLLYAGKQRRGRIVGCDTQFQVRKRCLGAHDRRRSGDGCTGGCGGEKFALLHGDSFGEKSVYCGSEGCRR